MVKLLLVSSIHTIVLPVAILGISYLWAAESPRIELLSHLCSPGCE